MVDKVMDYVKVANKAPKKTKGNKLLRLLMLILFSLILALLVDKLLLKRDAPATKLFSKKLLTKEQRLEQLKPKLRFYDVLVHEQQISQAAMPFVLEISVSENKNACAILVKKLHTLGLSARIEEFMQADKTMCQVTLGPYANLNAAYKVKRELYQHGYTSALRDNYPENK